MSYPPKKPLQTIRTVGNPNQYSLEQLQMAFMIMYALHGAEFWLLAPPNQA